MDNKSEILKYIEEQGRFSFGGVSVEEIMGYMKGKGNFFVQEWDIKRQLDSLKSEGKIVEAGYNRYRKS